MRSFIQSNRLNFVKIRTFSNHPRSLCGAETKLIQKKKVTEANFIFVIYLFQEVYRKIMSEIYFEGKTRYETGS